MTYNNNHHSNALVFSSQSHTAIEQIFASSGPVQTAQRTDSGGVAGMLRSHPLDAGSGISRVSARLPASQAGEWPGQLRHQECRANPQQGTRPDSAPTHSRLSASIGGRASRQRPAVTLLHLSIRSQIESRPNIQRSDAGTNSHPSGHTNRREAPIDPDNFRKAFMHAKRPPRGVWQDKDRNSCDRAASLQPAAVKEFTRSQATNNGVVRSQKSSANNPRTQPVQVWVSPLVKAELSRIAASDGLSLSSAGAALLERGIQQNVDMQYGALLRPIINDAIAKQMAGIATRLTWLLVRIAFDAGQTRSLVTNILGRQPGVTESVLKTLMESSGRSAKGNIMRRTPHISELISAVEQWMVEDDGGEKEKQYD